MAQLFILHVNDIDHVIETSMFHIFMDNTILYIKRKDHDKFQLVGIMVDGHLKFVVLKILSA